MCTKQLQAHSKNGGMIVFWHIPKTGGSTLRSQYTRRKHHSVTRWTDMGLNQHDYIKRKSRVEASFLSDTSKSDQNGYHGKTLFWEIHGGPSLPNLNQDIQHWRSLAQQHNKTFFAFTLFREGPSAAISYFNFYCPPCNDPHFVNGLQNTEQDFRRASLTWRNYQSRLLFHGQYDGNLWLNKTITPEETWNMYESSKLDWIGTTDALSNITIPLLEYLVTGHNGVAHKSATVKKEKVATERYKQGNISHIARSDLSSEVLDFLEENTSLDQTLWQWANRDYHWDRNNASFIQAPC